MAKQIYIINAVRVNRSRLRQNLSATDIYRKIGVDRTTWNRWLHGQGMHEDNFRQLCKILNETPEYLQGTDEEGKPQAPKNIKIHIVINGTTTEGTKDAQTIIHNLIAKVMDEIGITAEFIFPVVLVTNKAYHEMTTRKDDPASALETQALETLLAQKKT